MKHTPDPKKKWQSKLYDESKLIEFPKTKEERRFNAELETLRDLDKEVPQLVADVIEESISGRSLGANILHAQKRFASMMGKAAISNEILTMKIIRLTQAIIILTLILLVIGVLQLISNPFCKPF